MQTDNNAWLMDAILDGLSKLLSLSLDRQPASDMVEITSGTWMEALTEGRHWFPEDLPRIQASFRILAATCKKWPTPMEFLEELPPRPTPKEQAALKLIESDEAKEQRERNEAAQKARIRKIIAETAQMLRINE